MLVHALPPQSGQVNDGLTKMLMLMTASCPTVCSRCVIKGCDKRGESGEQRVARHASNGEGSFPGPLDDDWAAGNRCGMNRRGEVDRERDGHVLVGAEEPASSGSREVTGRIGLRRGRHRPLGTYGASSERQKRISQSMGDFAH